MKTIVSFFSIAVFGVVGMACATSGATTTSEPEATKAGAPAATATPNIDDLSWSEVKKAIDGGAILVDTRSAEEYQQGHITGAISVPDGDEAAFSRLPNNKSTHVIFYCNGPVCTSSRKAAEKAQKKGFNRVSEFGDGYPGWLMLM